MIQSDAKELKMGALNKLNTSGMGLDTALSVEAYGISPNHGLNSGAYYYNTFLFSQWRTTDLRINPLFTCLPQALPSLTKQWSGLV